MADPITRIQILDETTANQIAAGEVIERPSAVVKELVENALDAEASRVLVELEEGGKYLVRVTDDGCGMGQEDAVLALQRHATSKIATSDDLFRITTMGFRGEALPSIASVSRFTLTTRLAAGAADAPGYELTCVGGALESVVEVGARAGTSITVENLFYNVPARLKFLKSTSTELSHIVELMQRFALAFPEVAFRLTGDRREVFAAPGGGGPLDACVCVFGRDTARQLAPISRVAGAVTVTGYIGTPATLRGTRAVQHTFVNRRFIRNRAVTRALDEGFKSVQTVHGAKYPPAVINIAIDPSLIDVNVSPTKTEVRFTREGEVYSAVYHAVREALLSGALVATLGERPPRSGRPGDHAFAAPLLDVPAAHPATVRRDAGSWSVTDGASVSGTPLPSEERKEGDATSIHHPAARWPAAGEDLSSLRHPFPLRGGDGGGAAPSGSPSEGVRADATRQDSDTPSAGGGGDDPFEDTDGGVTIGSAEGRVGAAPGALGSGGGVAVGAPGSHGGAEYRPGGMAGGRVAEGRPTGGDYRGRDPGGVRILAQTRNTYIIAQTPGALLIIDQHIAHERVLYERFVAAARTGGIPVQRLVLPFTLELTRREALVVEKRLPELRQAGFDLEAFGGEAFLVRSVPAAVAQKTIKAQGGPEAVLREIVDEMVEKTVSRKLLLPAEEVLITASCKMAVKAGDPLTFDEMQALVEDLFRSENPYTCPHGRPILFELANSEIDRKFGR